jgi:divalent metal cation (Fe/Co/Zn/Cd) transporter
VSIASFSSLIWRWAPQPSWSGIAITVAALLIMPVLSKAKKAESRRIGNAALAADAVQSATCAYLASITLLGLVVNAVFHVGWVDSVAALAAVPILCIEGRRAFQGHGCECC